MKTEARIAALYIGIVLMMTVCLFSLYRASTNEEVRTALAGQYSRRLPIASRRGFIYDRCGRLLNAKRDGYICLVNPALVGEPRSVAQLLSEYSETNESAIVERLSRGVPFTMQLRDNGELSDIQGVYCFPNYAYKAQAAVHTVGYVNSDGKGVIGAERGFDGYLGLYLGGDVSYSYSADALGRPLGDSGTVLYDKGYSESSGVILTFDKRLQEELEAVAREHISAGALAVCEIESGELLASVSLPDFEEDRVSEYLQSNKGELINRCAASFTPGSIFKTVVAAAALERDIGLYDLEYECKGKVVLSDGKELSCHKRSGHGRITMARAYADSCNAYFINLAGQIGIGEVLETAGKMGMGEGELYGICFYGSPLPAPSDSEGFSANIAIGQGTLLMSPYEACRVFSCAASGYRTELSALREVFRGDSTLLRPERKRERVLSGEVCEKLLEMMGLCIADGLGKEAAPSDGDAGGKTATAQTGQRKDGKEILNTWFCGVYPLSKPRFAIAVLCDGNGGEGNPRAVFGRVCDVLSDMQYY